MNFLVFDFLHFNKCIYIYIYVYVYLCIYMYIYIYIYYGVYLGDLISLFIFDLFRCLFST